jgi:hypothetical protein
MKAPGPGCSPENPATIIWDARDIQVVALPSKKNISRTTIAILLAIIVIVCLTAESSCSFYFGELPEYDMPDVHPTFPPDCD